MYRSFWYNTEGALPYINTGHLSIDPIKPISKPDDHLFSGLMILFICLFVLIDIQYQQPILLDADRHIPSRFNNIETPTLGTIIFLFLFYLTSLFKRLAAPLPCKEAIGMKNGIIRDSQFSASADLPDFGLSYARLHGPKAWLGKYQNLSQWFQVSFSNALLLTGVTMQGRQDADEWVTKYIVMGSLYNVNWQTVLDEDGQKEVLYDIYGKELKLRLVLRNSCSY